MKTLGNLSPAQGSNRNKKRRGRGPGSGLGKTAGKGHKGQKARKGSSIALGRKGAQTSLFKGLPKYGFKNTRSMKEYHIVKLANLNVFDHETTVDAKLLMKKGLVSKVKHPIKVLFTEKLEKKLYLKVGKISASARAAVEKLGGTIEEV